MDIEEESKKVVYRRWKLILLSAFRMSLSFQQSSFICFLVPELGFQVGNNVKGETMGVLFAFAATLSLFSGPLWTALSDRKGFSWGRRRPYMCIGTSVAVFFLILFASLRSKLSLAWYSVLYVLYITSLTMAVSAWDALIEDIVKKEQFHIVKNTQVIFDCLGCVLGAGVLALVSTRMNQGATYAVILVLLVAGAGTAMYFAEPTRYHTRPAFSCTAVWADAVEPFSAGGRDMTLLFIAKLATDSCYVCFRHFSLFFLTETLTDYRLFGKPVGSAFSANGILFILAHIAGFFGYLVHYSLARCISPKAVLYASSSLQLLGVMILYFYTSYGAAIASAVLLGIGFGGWFPISDTIALQVLPSAQSFESSLGPYLHSTNIATIFALPVFGAILDVLVRREKARIGYGLLHVFMGIATVVAISAVFFMSKGKSRKPTNGPQPEELWGQCC